VPVKVQDGLDLPPPFRLVTLREVGDAFAHAKTIAAADGAGTLVHVGRFDLAEFAVVLEPDEPLWSVRRLFYAGLLALRDAVSAHAPPRRPMGFAWPGAIQVNGRLIGGARLAWPAESDENETPAWLVFGGVLRTAARSDRKPDLHPPMAALDEEGFDDVESGQLVESCARHLLVALDAWQPSAFGMIAKRYLRDLTHEKGGVPALDDNGDLLIRRPGQQQPDRHSIAAALAGEDPRP
jgi:biotin-(acetyl-CoA carboxylase) ligase